MFLKTCVLERDVAKSWKHFSFVQQDRLWLKHYLDTFCTFWTTFLPFEGNNWWKEFASSIWWTIVVAIYLFPQIFGNTRPCFRSQPALSWSVYCLANRIHQPFMWTMICSLNQISPEFLTIKEEFRKVFTI